MKAAKCCEPGLTLYHDCVALGVRAGGRGGSGQPRFFVRPQTPGRWWGTTVPGTIFDREGARVRGWCECTELGRGCVCGSDRRKRVLGAPIWTIYHP